MRNQINGALLATAVAALFAAGCTPASEEAKSAGKEVKCSGINACKGQGACAGAGHDCSGKNACKGQGITMTKAEDCTAKGGNVVES